MRALVIGYGSIGRRHYNLLLKNKDIKEIKVLTKQKIKNLSILKNQDDAIRYKPDYIIVCSNTEKHIKDIKFIEKNFKNKLVLVEKPLFEKKYKLNLINNNYFIGYNMRHHPLIKFIKEKIKNKRIWSVQVICGSYLPHWRRNINYTNSYSSKKNGGGVLLDLSHELDYVSWIFGKIKTNFSFNKKISNLKINSDDYLTLFGIIKNKLFVQINLNYFMRNPTRRMYIDGLNVSYDLDLIKNTINYYENGKKYYKKLKNYDLNEMYISQHKDIITGKNKVTCSYTEAEYIMNLIKDIKDKNFA